MKVLMIAENHGVLPETQIGLLLARSGLEVRFIFRTGSTSGDFLRRQGMDVQGLPLRGRLDVQSSFVRQRQKASAFLPVINFFQEQLAHALVSVKMPSRILNRDFPPGQSPLMRGLISTLYAPHRCF